MKFFLTIALLLLPSLALAGQCGERGGPGYRGSDGRCVGWAALARVCGSPPTQRCSPELVQADSGKAAEHGSKIIDAATAARDATVKKKQ